MAENDQEKTEYQSQKKLEQRRVKGEMSRSQELITFVVFALFLLFFGATRLDLLDGMGSIMGDLLRFDQHLGIGRDTIGEFMLGPILEVSALLAPMFALILLFSPLINMVQTGFNIASEKLQPDWNRLDPIRGVKRIFSKRQFIEGLKSAAKIALFTYLGWTAIYKALPTIVLMGGLGMREQMGIMIDVSLSIGIRISALMAILAIGDLGYQWWEFRQALRSTHQEMKDELKEREDDPLIKQRQRQIQAERARRQMMAEVPKASVVVTNPTHYAVALAYRRDKAPAPYVCAKGMEEMARRSREIVREHGVPVIENKPLAQALYRQVKVGHVIPGESFKAVAELLAFVFLLKKGKPRVRGIGARV